TYTTNIDDDEVTVTGLFEKSTNEAGAWASATFEEAGERTTFTERIVTEIDGIAQTKDAEVVGYDYGEYGMYYLTSILADPVEARYTITTDGPDGEYTGIVRVTSDEENWWFTTTDIISSYTSTYTINDDFEQATHIVYASVNEEGEWITSTSTHTPESQTRLTTYTTNIDDDEVTVTGLFEKSTNEAGAWASATFEEAGERTTFTERIVTEIDGFAQTKDAEVVGYNYGEYGMYYLTSILADPVEARYTITTDGPDGEYTGIVRVTSDEENWWFTTTDILSSYTSTYTINDDFEQATHIVYASVNEEGEWITSASTYVSELQTETSETIITEISELTSSNIESSTSESQIETFETIITEISESTSSNIESSTSESQIETFETIITEISESTSESQIETSEIITTDLSESTLSSIESTTLNNDSSTAQFQNDKEPIETLEMIVPDDIFIVTTEFEEQIETFTSNGTHIKLMDGEPITFEILGDILRVPNFGYIKIGTQGELILVEFENATGGWSYENEILSLDYDFNNSLKKRDAEEVSLYACPAEIGYYIKVNFGQTCAYLEINIESIAPEDPSTTESINIVTTEIDVITESSNVVGEVTEQSEIESMEMYITESETEALETSIFNEEPTDESSGRMITESIPIETEVEVVNEVTATEVNVFVTESIEEVLIEVNAIETESTEESSTEINVIEEIETTEGSTTESNAIETEFVEELESVDTSLTEIESGRSLSIEPTVIETELSEETSIENESKETLIEDESKEILIESTTASIETDDQQLNLETVTEKISLETEFKEDSLTIEETLIYSSIVYWNSSNSLIIEGINTELKPMEVTETSLGIEETELIEEIEKTTTTLSENDQFSQTAEAVVDIVSIKAAESYEINSKSSNSITSSLTTISIDDLIDTTITSKLIEIITITSCNSSCQTSLISEFTNVECDKNECKYSKILNTSVETEIIDADEKANNHSTKSSIDSTTIDQISSSISPISSSSSSSSLLLSQNQNQVGGQVENQIPNQEQEEEEFNSITYEGKGSNNFNSLIPSSLITLLLVVLMM
ncbi:uncharacterized protein KGF55_005345, partial [Candida pseudojiufengensis]|uniref:uncharacterized protein n=1 Tax=Candida pseudojiufengensis TaxID=497109 RepID=UPI0022245113